MGNEFENPDRYTSKSGKQVYDVIDTSVEDAYEPALIFYTGNVIKYAFRWWKKGGVHDIKKLQAYVNRVKDIFVPDYEEIPIDRWCEDYIINQFYDKDKPATTHPADPSLTRHKHILVDYFVEDFCDIEATDADTKHLREETQLVMRYACYLAMTREKSWARKYIDVLLNETRTLVYLCGKTNVCEEN